MQLERYEEFEVVADSLPNCVEIDERAISPVEVRWYSRWLNLFIGNQLYLFGTDSPDEIHVYAVVQNY